MVVRKKIINTIQQTKCALTIGSFDGIHKGHMEIINKLINIAKINKIPSVLITFNPHPKSIINSKIGAPWKTLISQDEKISIFKKLGIDYVWMIPFNKKFSNVTASDFFVNYIIKYFNPSCIIIGEDHRFGHKQEGNYSFLENIKDLYQFSIYKLISLKIRNINVRSSKIREYISKGKIKDANSLLGRNYSISGIVEKGKGIGKLIEYPTANIMPNSLKQLIPCKGVYCVDVSIYGKIYSGMCNIGKRPTLQNDKNNVIEVHIMTEKEMNLYGKTISIIFKSFIRDEKKYKDINELKNQLSRDRVLCMSI